MFDCLWLSCIFCKEQIEVQTKSGPCLLDDFKFEDNLPVWLMEDMNGDVIQCPKCQKKQKLIFDIEVKVKCKEIIPHDNLDLIEWLAKKRGLTD